MRRRRRRSARTTVAAARTSVRRPHFRDDSVIALACNRSPLATSTPEFCGNRIPRGTASATTAEEALTMRPPRRRCAARWSRPARRDVPPGRPGSPRRRATGRQRRRAASSLARSSRLRSRHRRLHPIEPAATNQFVDQHLVTAAHRAEDRARGDTRCSAWRTASVRLAAPRVQSRRQTWARPSASRSSPPIPRRPRRASDPPNGPPPAHRTGLPPGRPRPDRRRAASATADSARLRYGRGWRRSTRPAIDSADDGMPVSVSGR